MALLHHWDATSVIVTLERRSLESEIWKDILKDLLEKRSSILPQIRELFLGWHVWVNPTVPTFNLALHLSRISWWVRTFIWVLDVLICTVIHKVIMLSNILLDTFKMDRQLATSRQYEKQSPSYTRYKHCLKHHPEKFAYSPQINVVTQNWIVNVYVYGS